MVSRPALRVEHNTTNAVVLGFQEVSLSDGFRIHNDVLAVWRDAVVHFQKNPGKTAQAKEMIDKTIRSNMEDVRRLWDVFTQERGELGRYLTDPKRERSAYLIGFHLSNVARMHMLVNRLIGRQPHTAELLRDATTVTVHDLGAGTGAQSQGIFSAVRAQNIPTANWHWNFIDKQNAFLEAAAFTMQRLVNATNVQTHRTLIDDARLTAHKKAAATEFDIIVLGNVWNEISRHARARQRLMTQIAQFPEVAHPALILIVEPANQNIARSVMELREELFNSGWTPLYPCSAAIPCPMLERTRDWCFSEGNWQLPKEAQLVDKLLGTERAHLSSSMYALANLAMVEQLKAKQQKLQVVVGKPRIPSHPKSKIKEIELLLCTQEGLTKKKPAANEAALQRGEVLSSR